MQRRNFIHTVLAFMALPTLSGALVACDRQKKLAPIPAHSTVLAFGDSLTEGYGTSPASSYPTVLESITGWKVINAGVSGDTTVDALARLPQLLAQYQPKLVLTCIGGNDMLKRMSETNMQANIIEMCRQIKNSGAQNMLIAVPRFSVLGAALGSLKDHPLYQTIATEVGIPLQEGAWSKVLSDESLRSDPIHANAQGYALFAELLATSLKKVGLLQSQ